MAASIQWAHEEGAERVSGTGLPRYDSSCSWCPPALFRSHTGIRWPPTSTQMKIFAVFTEPAAGSTSRKCVAGCCWSRRASWKTDSLSYPDLGTVRVVRKVRQQGVAKRVRPCIFPPFCVLFFFNPLLHEFLWVNKKKEIYTGVSLIKNEFDREISNNM